jgi:hypothetical protein
MIKYIYAIKIFKTEKCIHPERIYYHLDLDACVWVFDYTDNLERIEVVQITDSEDERYIEAKKNHEIWLKDKIRMNKNV